MTDQKPENKKYIPETCPECGYVSPELTVKCPHCGYQLTHPHWKRIGALILLILIAYGLVKCHIKMLDGFY